MQAAAGRFEELPSGSLRVSAYAGVDPLSSRRTYLKETIPAGPRAQTEAERALNRLLNQVDDKRNPSNVGDDRPTPRRDPDWGALAWVTTTTGARRGEMCGLHLEDLDLDNKVLHVHRAIGIGDHGGWVEKDTKTHDHLLRREKRADALGRLSPFLGRHPEDNVPRDGPPEEAGGPSQR